MTDKFKKLEDINNKKIVVETEHNPNKEIMKELRDKAIKLARKYKFLEKMSCKAWIDSEHEDTEEREFQLYYQGAKDVLILFFNLTSEDLK